MKNILTIGSLQILTSIALVGCNTYQFEYREVNTTRYSPSSGNRSSSKAEASSPINSSSGNYGYYGTQEPVRKPPTFSN